MVDIHDSRNLVIDGLTVMNGPQFHFALFHNENVVVQRSTVFVDIKDHLDIHGYLGGAPLGASHFDILHASGRAESGNSAISADQNALSAIRRLRLPKKLLELEEWWDHKWHTSPPIPMVWALNTDGIDVSGRNFTIHNCSVTNFDDSVVVKPSNLHEQGYCSRDVDIRDIRVTWGVGVSIGSVTPSQFHACVDNVTARHLHFDKPLKAIYIKPNPKQPGNQTASITNILYEDVVIERPVWFAIWIGPQQQHQPKGGTDTGCSFFYPLRGHKCPTDPQVTLANITLRRVSARNGRMSPGILLLDEANPGQNFNFDGVVFSNFTKWPKSNYVCENTQGTATGGTDPVPPCFKDQNEQIASGVAIS